MPSAFISYSWEDDSHRNWVRELAARLRADGVERPSTSGTSHPASKCPHSWSAPFARMTTRSSSARPAISSAPISDRAASDMKAGLYRVPFRLSRSPDWTAPSISLVTFTAPRRTEEPPPAACAEIAALKGSPTGARVARKPLIPKSASARVTVKSVARRPAASNSRIAPPPFRKSCKECTRRFAHQNQT